jgi:hypothetical protein
MIGKCFLNELELEVTKMHVVMHTVPQHCMQMRALRRRRNRVKKKQKNRTKDQDYH